MRIRFSALLLALLCSLSLWAQESKLFVCKDQQFTVNCSAPLSRRNDDGMVEFRTGNVTAAKNSFAIVVTTEEQFNTRYKIFKQLVKKNSFSGTPVVKETQFAGHPSLDVEAITNDGFPFYGKIISTPNRSYLVAGVGHETAASREFVQSFRLTDSTQSKK